LECREELCVQERGLRISETRRYVSADAEVGVLIDCAGNERGNLGGFLDVGSEYMRKRGCEGGGGLDGYEVGFAHGITDMAC